MRIWIWLGLLWSGWVAAEVYQPSPLTAGWRLEQGKLSCRLSQTVEDLGTVAFEHRAGKPLRFWLQLAHEPRVVDAGIQIRPAPWQHRYLPGRRYAVDRIEAAGTLGRRLVVEGPVAEQMLAAVHAGRFPRFDYRRPWGNVLSEAQVSVSAVRFWERYPDFQDCRAKLPPYGLDDFTDLRYYFRERQVELPQAARTRLSQLADLLRRLGKGQVAVRNVTAGTGKAAESWFRKRFLRVRRWLRSQGLAANRITAGRARGKPVVEIRLFGPEGLRLYHYGRRQSRLTAAQRRRLDLLARYVNEFFPGRLVIHGYSDGARWRSERTNLALSRRWAERIRDYLAGRGVAPQRMTVKAWGSRHRVASNLTKAGQARNRRVRIDFDERPLPGAGH
ncbi:sodium-type flagellar protein MotY [Methylomarinovum tepidoasis]|uniref:Sodium-type flagellar protein MotY n=1 Tax=Methylomarinovum tepidoasis TaxID=2840183 RepID=A0AAU9CE66_9GAMM|nr:OmpA family protein [Methylomarinovum sp. IN45]BCX89086.1 sodium-type flagellar protein MotY [Methylomarinovum sp. IN45]